MAKETCSVFVVGPNPSLSDIVNGYNRRGVDVLECEGRRSVAEQTHTEEHRLEDEHLRLRALRNCPFYRRLTGTCLADER